jgi:hypothetical protein
VPSCVRNWGIPKRKQSAKFSRFLEMMQWESLKLKSDSTALQLAACQWTVTSVPGDCQRAEMLMSLTKCRIDHGGLSFGHPGNEVGIRRGSTNTILTEDLGMQRVASEFVPKILSSE